MCDCLYNVFFLYVFIICFILLVISVFDRLSRVTMKRATMAVVVRDEVNEVLEDDVLIPEDDSDDVPVDDTTMFVAKEIEETVEKTDLLLDLLGDDSESSHVDDDLESAKKNDLLNLLDVLDDSESTENDYVVHESAELIDLLDTVDENLSENEDKTDLLNLLDGIIETDSSEDDAEVVKDSKASLLDLLDGLEDSESSTDVDTDVVENSGASLLDLLDGLEDSDSTEDDVAVVKDSNTSLLDLLDGLDDSESTEDDDAVNSDRTGDSLLDLLDADDTSSEYSEETESNSLENLLSGLKGNIPAVEKIVLPIVPEKTTKAVPDASVYDWFSVGAKSIIDDSGLTHSYGVSADSNKNKKGMEDTNVLCCPLVGNTALFCVFDGHSGADCAKKLASIFPGIVRKCIKDVPEYAYDLSFWISIYEKTDEALLQYEYQGSTSTTMIVWEKNGKRYMQCSNIGDSEAFLRHNDTIIPITDIHKLENPEERDRILAMGVELEDKQTRISGLSVTRSFGDHFAKEIDSGMISIPFVSQVYEVFENDIVILASDGLWDSFDAESAFAQVTSEPQVAANRLTSKAKEGTTDNITTMVVQF